MSIKHDGKFSLNGVTSNFCMKHDGDTTRAVLGLIQVRKTKGRDDPPACGNGFTTDYLAFAKGHVMALELGGSDHRYNVVPQFEHWQGKPNGEWRQMEIELEQHAGRLMLVELGYGRGGGRQSHDVMVEAFQADRLMDWTDERIPDEFHVRVWPNPGLDPAVLDNDTKFDAAVLQLAKSGPVYQKRLVLGNAMPQPDRGMYVVQLGVGIVKELYQEYVAQPGLKRAQTDLTFMLEEGTVKKVRTQLQDEPGVTAPEATGLQLMPLILAMHDTTEAKVRRKYKLRAKEGVKLVREDELNEGSKRPPGGVSGATSTSKKVKL